MYIPTVVTQAPTRETETELARLAARWSRTRRKATANHNPADMHEHATSQNATPRPGNVGLPGE